MLARGSALVWIVAGLSVLSYGALPDHLGGFASGPIGGSALPTAPGLAALPAQGPSAPSLAPTLAARAAHAHQILANAKAAHIPNRDLYVPNMMGGGYLSGGVVHPLTTVAPAPMGIGDFGVRNTTGTPTPYMIQSTGWEGSLTLNRIDSFLIDNDGPDTFTVQLNTVTTNTTVWGNSSGSYWIQNVFDYTPSSQSLIFIDNIWNFSSPSGAQPASTFYSYNGTPVPSVGYYFDLGPLLTVPMPFTIHLYVNTSTTVNGTTLFAYPTVRFGYNILNATGVSTHHGVYDTVLFNSNARLFRVPLTKFMVNGAHLTPTNFLLYDSELMLGGPGGGTTASIYGINGSESLSYLNGGTNSFQSDPTAWNVGTDTGETSEGIAESYARAGTVSLSAGPSLPMPLWNATPGGEVGRARVAGGLDPSNGFLFVSPGKNFTRSTAAWAPTEPNGAFDFTLPPGNYTVEAMMSEYDPWNLTIDAKNGTTNGNIVLTPDAARGVYTPLVAWNDGQLAGISSRGDGTLGNPYLILSNQHAGLDPLFGESNDYLYLVFPGLLIANTNAYVTVQQPASFGFTYPDAYLAGLTRNGLPFTNHLQLEFYNASRVTLWGASDITGWFFGPDYGPEAGLPLANVVFWDVSNSLIAGNTFVSQGSSLVLLNGPATGGGNVVWGNTFENGLQAAAFLNYGAPGGLFEFESGDLVYNNYVTTTLPAFSPSSNLWSGAGQTNQNDWNLSEIEPATVSRVVNGFTLSGSVVGSPWQCGNAWGAFTSVTPVPYNANGSIVTGGDYCPYPVHPATYPVTFTETGLSNGTWSVLLAGETRSASASSPISFAEPFGTWAFTASTAPGILVTPGSGNVTVAGSAQTIPIAFTLPAPPPPPPRYTVTFTETGLPFGSWSVLFRNETASTLVGDSIAFSAVAGTYSFSILPQPGYTASPSSGSVTLPGTGNGVSVTFSPPPRAPSVYPVTVSESGLALGTAWSITLNGDTLSTFGASLIFEQANGSYAYQVAGVAGYAAPPNGMVSVNGGAASVTLPFAPLDGYLNGTVSVPGAIVVVNGNAVPASTGSFSITLPPGTYAVSATRSGYAPYDNTVTIAAGKATHLAIALQSVPSPSGSALSSVQFGGLIGAILVLALAVGIAGWLVRARTKPETSGSPRPWDESVTPPPDQKAP
ncbi:MAG: thermopsin family protease [Thermoplasmata archaeon]|nr:thermopsin family protease [Thermoplasmata archaeon]